MYEAGLVILIILCALFAVRSRQLLSSVLWLACTSAVLAILLYTIGAYEIAVIELSVGAGLVTILIIFVLHLVGETGVGDYPLPFRLFGFGTIFLVAATLAILLLAGVANSPAQPLAAEISFSTVVWQQRGVDTMLQLVLIFSGSLGILSLVVEKTLPNRLPVDEQLTSVQQSGSPSEAPQDMQVGSMASISVGSEAVQKEEKVKVYDDSLAH